MARNILLSSLLLYINKFIKSQSSDQQSKLPINTCTNYKISQVYNNIITCQPLNLTSSKQNYNRRHMSQESR